MKYKLINTKAGWVVQNTNTYSIVAGPYSSEYQAKAVVQKLAPAVRAVVKDMENAIVNNLITTGDK